MNMSKLSDLIRFKAKPVPTGWAGNRDALFKPYAETANFYVNELTDRSSYIGIEVEVENVTQTPTGAWQLLWRVEEDRSLRNNGLEFISLALRGEQIPYALTSLFESALPPTVHFSGRTSIHIHLNVQDKTPDELAKIILTYLPLEKLLFQFAGEHREKNIFCVPLSEIEMTDNLFNAIKDLNTKEIKQLQSENYRYSALNLGPVTTFGTIEFRHLGGTRDVSRIMNWINFILSIQKYALATPLEDLIKEVIALNTNSEYRHFAQKVFGRYFVHLVCEDMDSKIAEGVLSVKRSLFSNGFYNELRQGKFKESPYQKMMNVEKTKEIKAIYSTAIFPPPNGWIIDEIQERQP